MLRAIQNELFDLGADLATPGEDFAPSEMTLRIIQPQIDRLEREIDRMNEALEPLSSFILPGGGAGAAVVVAGPEWGAGHGAAEVRKGPARLEDDASVLVDVVDEEDAGGELGEEVVDPRAVKGGGGGGRGGCWGRWSLRSINPGGPIIAISGLSRRLLLWVWVEQPRSRGRLPLDACVARQSVPSSPCAP
jgi:hypothetical protein